MNKNICVLFVFLLCFVNATAQDSILEQWTVLEEKVMKHLHAAEYEKTIEYLIESQKISIDNDSLQAIALNNLAYLYEVTGQYKKAEPLSLKCIALDKRILGVNSTEYAISVNNLALLYDHMGRYKEAQPLYFKSLDIRKKNMDSLNINIADSYNNIAANYSAMGSKKMAMKYYERALNIYKQKKNKKDYLPILFNNMGNLYLKMKRFSKAKEMHERAIAMYSKETGKDLTTYIYNKANLAEAFYCLKQYDQAIETGHEVLNLRGKLLDKKHPEYLFAGLGKNKQLL